MDDSSFELFLKHIEYCRLFGQAAVDSAFDGNIEVAESAGQQTAHWANLVLDNLHRPDQPAIHPDLLRPSPPGLPDLEFP